MCSSDLILGVLTIIFTLTIPPSVVSAIYGMNVNIPGGIETGSWTFLGPFTTFIVILIISAIPALGMLTYFYKRGWLLG